MLKVQLLSADGRLPTRAHSDDAGLDLYAAYDQVLQPRSRHTVSTQIAVELPAGTYGQVAPRSSLALKQVDTCGGVIDPGYRGEVFVLLHNHRDVPYHIAAGHRIAQLIVHNIHLPRVESNAPTRNLRGFGSSGQ